MSMSRKLRKIHPTDSDKVSDCEGSDTKASSEREQESETHKVEHRDFGGTVSESVAEILKRIPVLQPDSDALRQETLDARRESHAGEPAASSESEKQERLEETRMQAAGTAHKIKPVDSIRESINQDGAVLLDIKQGLCFSMNPVGSRIWEMMKKECSLEQIAGALELEFQVPRSQVEADIAAFVGELRKSNLIEPDSPAEQGKGSWISKLIQLRTFRRS